MNRRDPLRFAALVAVYLVVALPFKAMNLIPGFTDVRPVMALGPVYAVFFGPAGCLACGVGNLLADAADDAVRWTSIAGFASNVLGPLLVWWFWTRVSRTPFSLRTARDLLRHTLLLVAMSALETAIVAPAVALVYPEVDAAFLARAVFGNTAGFPVFLGIPLSILMQEEFGFVPVGRKGRHVFSRSDMKTFPDFRRGMGFGGWLTNYKRFNVLPPEWRTRFTAGDWEHFRTYLAETDAENVAAMGFDHVRVGFDQIVLEEKPGVFRDEIFDLLDRFCGWFESRGIGVVLNLHKAVGNYCDIHEENALLDDPALQDRFVALWEAVARRFAHRPAVAFELLNEVLDVPAEKWFSLARRTVAAVRRLDPARWIVVGPTCWNHPWALRALEPFDDPRVAYTFHMYEPSAFTHQRGVLQPAHCFYNRDMPYPGDPERYRDHARETGRDPHRFDGFAEIGRDFLADVLRDAFDWKDAHPDRILWCGEFGTIRHAKIAWREAWMRDVVSLLKEHGVPWCVWNYLSTPNDGNRFSLVDDDTRRILSPALLRACLGEDGSGTLPA